MSEKIEFYLNNYDTEKLLFLKESSGKNLLSLNEYAAELFSNFILTQAASCSSSELNEGSTAASEKIISFKHNKRG